MSAHRPDAVRALNAESRLRRAIHDWIREDAPLAVKMTVMPEHVAALVRRLAAEKERGGGHVT